MRLSIVTAILNSHEIVRRQVLRYKKMDLPDDVEIVFIDDGSEPPLSINGLKNLTLFATHDFRPWTQPTARNKGAEIASGEYLLCTDIDHIIQKAAINLILSTKYDVVRFKRYVGILDENGAFSDSMDDLKKYGYIGENKRISAHSNSYAIKRDLFLSLGGSQQKAQYPNRDEVPLKRKLKHLAASGEIKIIPDDERPNIYMIPNGRFCGSPDYNPFGLFHNLNRKSDEKA